VQGVVKQYLMNPDALVDGLLLSNNTIIRFPPHLGQVLTQTVIPQDLVRVEGFFESSGTFHASSIIDLQSQRTLGNHPLRRGNHLRLVRVVYLGNRSARTARFEFSLKESRARSTAWYSQMGQSYTLRPPLGCNMPLYCAQETSLRPPATERVMSTNAVLKLRQLALRSIN
jgi:hypothetical protein